MDHMWNASGNHGSSEINFTPLFRLLDDFGRYSGSHAGARATPPTFQPKFDVRETSSAYELQGELPGAKRENINIEFTQPQTLQIRGRIERTHTAGNDSAKAITEAGEENDNKDAGSSVSDAGEEKEKKGGRASPPLKATVQDEAEAEAEEQGTGAAANTPATSVAVPANSHSFNPASFIVPCIPPKKAAIKYWITERSIGEFTRSFSLPARVEHEGVTANLKDGILTVVIPKSRKHEARRIVVA